MNENAKAQAELDEQFLRDFEELSLDQTTEVKSTPPVPSAPTPAQVTNGNETVLQSVWHLPKQAVQAALDISQVYRTKHGMFAGVPIVCNDTNCPYVEVCMIDPSLRVIGQRCIMEAGAIIARFEAWCRHFDIDLSQPTIKDEDLVDVSLIRDLVDNEVQMLRAENRVALNADFIGKTISQIDHKGKVYYEETVTPEAQFKLTLQDKRYKILNLLNSTRKDKAAADKKLDLNPSQRAASIFKKVAEMLPCDVDSVDFSVPEIQDIQSTPVQNEEQSSKE